MKGSNGDEEGNQKKSNQEGNKEKHQRKTRKKAAQKSSKEKIGLNDDEYDDLMKENEKEEVSFSSFSQKLAFALIAASWAIQSKASGESNKALVVCLGFSVFYLALKWIGHILNIRHYREIIDTEQNKVGKYDDASLGKTWYGIFASLIFYLEIIALGFSALSFGYTCYLIYGAPLIGQ